MPATPHSLSLTRRQALLATGSTLSGLRPARAADTPPVNLARVASVRCAGPSAAYALAAVNSDEVPPRSLGHGRELWSTEAEDGVQWIEYRWSRPVRTDRIEVFWGLNPWTMKLPTATRLLWWDGRAYREAGDGTPLGMEADRFNEQAFAPLSTTRLRLEVTPAHGASIGVLQWRVWSHGPAPDFPPRVEPGPDRCVIVEGASYLHGRVVSLHPGTEPPARWRQLRGPGRVRFDAPDRLDTTARADRPGDYELELSAGPSRATLRLRVEPPPPPQRLDVVYTTPYALTDGLWRDRTRSLIVNWIPHCVRYCERSDLPNGRGGLANFIEAGKALRGEPHEPRRGWVFSDAWVHQTLESICLGLMVDAQGDAQMLQAQAELREALERWIPIVLAAQHPDGYLHTAYTLASREKWPQPWSPAQRGNHEGYVAGYFIEAAINHHTLTGGRDLRLYNAARRLADCWVTNLGPGRRPWFDGHQEMEQALVRFGRFVNDVEGGGRGDAYVALARFLLDSRAGGTRYDQSHLPPQQQYEAVGHAVRAVYQYSGMADIAAQTGDGDYQSAVLSLWDNLVNRKYYVTGGVGSGDTDEGFGDDYALRHDGYCESCSSCGLVFFQFKLHLAYHQARFADLYEETIYNALLGSIDHAGRNFTYTNPLVGSRRYAWHACPCCVGNIPRTLLMLPTWAYSKGGQGLFVNLFLGSRMQGGPVNGVPIEVVQDTRYPWDGAVRITLNPAAPVEFALHLRMPDRQTSTLYRATPEARGLRRLQVNGQSETLRPQDGYAVIRRRWQAGDTVSFELPLPVQRVVADARVAATRGQVALRRGPLVYSVERIDQSRLDTPVSSGPLEPRWRQSDRLGGHVGLHGQWQDGTPLSAVPYFLRMNREPGAPSDFPPEQTDQLGYGRSRVWLSAARRR